ncbi:peptidoglycan DD-metalloendopeptidase family protein [Pedobacter heparinus]|uniref:peptidoglycan DD-metalloendopeptidase family protein n=1 Tax=Pedobacter heparinus TaxID=984 RepID=UPI002930241A|nr:peptidoglycan DD-metalloendopeptidase family protein [Pedobacter heparinus]
MKKSFLTILLSLGLCIAYGQTESPESKYAVSVFKKYYNNNQFDSIFSMFSASTKVALPLDKTRGFLNQLKSKYGNLTEMSFQDYQNGFGIYKSAFQNGLLTLSIAVNKDKEITGLYAKPYEEATQSLLKRNITAMRLPFNGAWSVFWGGDTKESNYHVVSKFQKNAFDIVIHDAAGKSFKTTGKTNEDYYAFGQPLLAPCDAEVVLAVDGVKDNVPGAVNPMYVVGNSVLLKTKNKEYILFAHFKQHSLKVKQGDQVKRGQLLGLCGNSGNSSEPHLHFHIQDAEDFNKATGVKCYFDQLKVNGAVKTDYSPVKGDRVTAVNSPAF